MVCRDADTGMEKEEKIKDFNAIESRPTHRSHYWIIYEYLRKLIITSRSTKPKAYLISSFYKVK